MNVTSNDSIISDLMATMNHEDEAKKPSNELGKDDFLKLLITQLKNQDPLSPLDDKEFIAQQAQFTQVEQMTNLNANFQKFMDSFNDPRTQAVSYLGTEVEVSSDDPEVGSFSGTVKEVRFKDGVPLLVVEGAEVPLDKVLGVKIPELLGAATGSASPERKG